MVLRSCVIVPIPACAIILEAIKMVVTVGNVTRMLKILWFAVMAVVLVVVEIMVFVRTSRCTRVQQAARRNGVLFS
jgi:hypothetical protein